MPRVFPHGGKKYQGQSHCVGLWMFATGVLHEDKTRTSRKTHNTFLVLNQPQLLKIKDDNGGFSFIVALFLFMRCGAYGYVGEGGRGKGKFKPIVPKRPIKVGSKFPKFLANIRTKSITCNIKCTIHNDTR